MKLRTATCVLTVALTGWAGLAWSGEPIDVNFLPPELEAQKGVCTPSKRDEDMVAFWLAWDGKALPERDVYTIIRDMGRLRDLNAIKYEKVINRISELLPAVKKSYSRTDALFDRTRTLLAMGEESKVRQDGMVAALLSAGGHSTGALNTLANYLIEGKGIAQDRERGLKLKIEAAYAGNPDAILDLARMSRAGETLDNWDVEPEIAVNMAFGSLVGTLNNGICDRVSRIAREYEDGEIVRRNPATAVAWYRFAADLGDTNAAWRVAEYHLESVDIRKDNATLVRYLTQAADGGNMSAILEIGKAYADGSLFEQDRDKALHYYSLAAKAGNQAGLIREAQLFEKSRTGSPEDSAAFEAILRELVKRDTAPSWAFTRLARIIIEQKGSWAASAEVRPLLEKAVAARDSSGHQDLAMLLVRESRDPATFARASDLLIHAVQVNGEVDALPDLRRLYQCQSPGKPDFASAEYWSSVEEGAGNKTLVMRPEEIARLGDLKNPLTIAALQTQALYGRPSAIALYQSYLKVSRHAPDVLKFWDDYAKRIAGTDAAATLLDFKLKLDRGDIANARNTIKAAPRAVSADSGLAFARFLLENYGTDQGSVELARSVLKPLADLGIGRAISLLEGMAGTEGSQRDTIQSYRQIMQDRGDMASQLLLAETAADEKMREFYYNRAIGSQRCDYDDNLLLAEFAMRNNRADEAQRWLTTALNMVRDDAWRQVKIGDMYMEMATPDAVKTAIGLYEDARKAGETLAFYRLVNFYSNSSSPAYNPRVAGETFVELVGRSDVKEIPGELLMLQKLRPEIRRLVGTRLDIKALYTRSAEAGQPVAMRELAKILRKKLDEKDSVETAANWLQKAAKAGDPEAMYLLSESYAYGTGVEPDSRQAHYWMGKAAEAGNQDAIRIFALMKQNSEG